MTPNLTLKVSKSYVTFTMNYGTFYNPNLEIDSSIYCYNSPKFAGGISIPGNRSYTNA